MTQFESLVYEMWDSWKSVTGGDGAFPKLHMVMHCAQFAKKHSFLGKFSEAQLESCHSKFSRDLNNIHVNTNPHKSEQFRRVLADAALKAIAPVLNN